MVKWAVRVNGQLERDTTYNGSYQTEGKDDKKKDKKHKKKKKKKEEDVSEGTVLKKEIYQLFGREHMVDTHLHAHTHTHTHTYSLTHSHTQLS